MLQHQDMNVGPGLYKHLAPDEMLVTKIFYTIQGEGPYAGWPALFVRLAGCNRGRKDDMGCSFCDTAFYFGQGKRMKFDEIIGELKQKMPHPEMYYPLVVITGGEPMMQDNIVGFIMRLRTNDFFEVQIESNGDRLATDFLQANLVEDVTLVVSPKTNKNTYHPIRPDIFNRASVLKFVISGDPTSPYYNVPYYADSFAFGLSDPRPVFLSPLTEYKAGHEPGQAVSAWDDDLVDRELTRRNFKRAKELALASGFRLSMQQHLWFETE
jgi:7-carboxy-7-deazaguanine synthase